MIEQLKESRNDIVYFIENFVRDSESGKLFKLYDYQKKALTEAFERDNDGRFRFWEIFISWPRKDGKTEPMGTGIAQWYLYTRTGTSCKIISPQSREHAEGIFADKLKKAILKNQTFEPITVITKNVIEVPQLGNKLTILPTEDVGMLGWEDDLILFDEIGALRPWQYDLYYNLQSGQGALIGKGRDALLVGISTFGDETDGHPLYDAYERSQKGEDQRLYFNYSGANQNPLVTKEYLERQEKILPRAVFLKFHCNQPGSKTGLAISNDDFSAIINHDLVRMIKSTEGIRVGLDVGITHDPAAKAGVAIVGNVVQLRNLECWIPTKDSPVFLPDFFGRVREYLLDNPNFESLSGDPYEWRAEYQKLVSYYNDDLIRQFIFTEANRKKLFKNLISLIKNRQLEIYWEPDSESMVLFKKQLLGLSIDSSWRVTHGRYGDDLVVAVAIACLDAVEDFEDFIEWKLPKLSPLEERLQAEERDYQRRMQPGLRLDNAIPDENLTTQELQKKRFREDGDGTEDDSWAWDWETFYDY
jgi:hypothetical protein